MRRSFSARRTARVVSATAVTRAAPRRTARGVADPAPDVWRVPDLGTVSGVMMPGTVRPDVTQQAVTFRFVDPDRRLDGVELRQEIGIPPAARSFDYDEASGGWQLRLDRPPVWRMEYLLELRHREGDIETVTDPANPLFARGAFGDKSVIEFPGYRVPGWLGAVPDQDRPDAPLAAGHWREFEIPSTSLRHEVSVRVWSPAGADPGRVLVAHDGPEYDRLAALGRFAAAMIGSGRLPPFHLVLLGPGDRNRWYSANPEYARALAREVLPELRARFAVRQPIVGMGASLGGLAMLFVQRRFPDAFGGLFLQSASFFVPEYDRHESGFSGYRPVVRFVLRAVRASNWPDPVPAALTCGTAEENLHNNRLMAKALATQGYPAALAEVPDAHNFTAWRDAFDPHLTDLLASVWS